MEQWDVIVIGAGVVGSAVARELARYRLNVAVLEKELDVACGNSSRNTGMLHAGFTYKPGSLKAECAVEGNKEFDRVAAELGVPFKRTGKLVVGFTDHDMENILKFKAIGEQNGGEGMRIIDKDEIERIEPHAGGKFAMLVPSSGILDPMAYTIALAENAAQNGVRFFFDRKVTAIERFIANNCYLVHTPQGAFRTKWIVNCAEAYPSQISEMLGYPNYPVRGFKGEYFVLDKKAGAVLDFKLESDQEHNPNTVNLVGIESPGITCALPLARRAVARLMEVEKSAVNEGFDPVRPAPKRFYDMTREEQAAAIAADPDYGEVVCRCENVTRAGIRRAIRNPLGVHRVTGIKNRTRATMGRCQGGYCETRITEMIEQELGLDPDEVRYSKPGSYMSCGRVRERRCDCTVELVEGERVVKRRRMPKALPSEMVQIKLRAEDLNQTDDLEVRVSC